MFSRRFLEILRKYYSNKLNCTGVFNIEVMGFSAMKQSSQREANANQALFQAGMGTSDDSGVLCDGSTLLRTCCIDIQKGKNGG